MAKTRGTFPAEDLEKVSLVTDPLFRRPLLTPTFSGSVLPKASCCVPTIPIFSQVVSTRGTCVSSP